jgi:predicted adenine nucleotide alpha hydrolase (AANH) superfamily ATPase
MALFVHVCCAPDAAYVVALLQTEYDVRGFFYNPNIEPADEYDRRLGEARKVGRLLSFDLEEGPADQPRWEAMTRRFAAEPEKGRRCAICYAMRLDLTARRARESGFPSFTTIMSVSPRKDAGLMNRIGLRLGRKYGLQFLAADFKKKDGFRKSVEISRRLGLYRQNYCGCRYSLRPPARSVDGQGGIPRG